jgi:hypothetical protein
MEDKDETIIMSIVSILISTIIVVYLYFFSYATPTEKLVLILLNLPLLFVGIGGLIVKKNWEIQLFFIVITFVFNLFVAAILGSM